MADNPNEVQGLPPGAVLKPIGTPPPVDDPSQVQGLPPGATLQPLGSSATTAAAPPPGGILSDIGDAAKGIGEGAVSAMGSTIQALPYVGKKIITPEAMAAERAAFAPGSPAEKLGQYGGEGAESVLEFVLGDEALKGLALADKVGLAGEITKIMKTSPYIGKLLEHGVNAARMGTVGATQALARGATLPQAAATGAATGVGGEALDTAVSVVKNIKVNPFKEILQGKGIAQPAAADAVRDAVTAGSTNPNTIAAIPTTPILDGNKTILDKPLSDLSTQAKDAYKQIDNAVGFDLKAAKDSLKNDQYNLKQLGNTPADAAQRVNLQASIADTTKRVADAEAKLTAQGIDPKSGDELHKKMMAGSDLKNAVVKATNADGTINVDKLLTSTKNLRFAKKGDRLGQFASPQAADDFIEQLQAAKDAGIHAVRTQAIAKWAAGILGAATIGGAAVEGIKHVLPATP